MSKRRYKKHMDRICKVRDIFNKDINAGLKFDRMPRYSRLLAKLKLNFIKGLGERDFSMKEAQLLDIALEQLTYATLDYTRYSFSKTYQ